MKNIFLFIRRYFTFLSFLLLQVFAIILLTNASKTHEAFFSEAVNNLTGNFNLGYNNLRGYFGLKETNRQLSEENARLRNMLTTNFQLPDSSTVILTDTLTRDTLGRSRKFTYLPAKVVGNTFTLQANFLTLERGSAQGVTRGMAVAGPNGIVGTVVGTSPNFSKVMSLLHHNSKVSVMLKKDNSTGSLEWDGSDPGFLTLRNITKGAKVAVGDTVLTSTYSANYPSHLVVGTVASISSESASNFYTLKIRTATNFFNIQYVYLIKNVRYAEQVQLETETTAPKTP